MRRTGWRFAIALLGVASAGCSEKPLQQKLVWEPYLFTMKAALRGVVATSPSDVLTVGFNIPEHSLFALPVSLQRVGGTWASLPVLGHAAESLQLFDLARADDGGALYVDRGAGWEILAGPQIANLQFTDVAFDADGTPWFTADYPSGDVTQGVLYALRGSTFVATPIQRSTAGACNLQSIAFDVEGHGWVGGGRPPDDPFLAGNVTGKWVESVLENESERYPPNGEVERGGEIQSISVVSATSAVAVGQAEELGPEGYIEFVPRLYQLVPRPIGEVDKPALLTDP